MNFNGQIKRVAVLYSELSGYMAACLKALKTYYDVELLVFKWPSVQDAPFDEENTFGWIDQLYDKQDMRADEILKIVDEFGPQGLFIPGWIDPDYLKVARVFRRRNIPVVAGCDTPWTGSLRQRISKYLAPWYLHTAIDVLWVAGEEQRKFARHLGYTSEKCWSGLYACDWERFVSKSEKPVPAEEQGYFLYIGRYCEEKGIDLLVNAYRKYRHLVSDPWPLVCAGSGAGAEILKGVSGIEDRGFVQPANLPALMNEAEALVLPSRKEPWGVVIQEAAANKLPLICSSVCGAAVHLLQDRYNGFLFELGDTEYLARCFVMLHRMHPQRRMLMGQRSFELSKQFTPERWAETLVEGLEALSDSNKDLVLV